MSIGALNCLYACVSERGHCACVCIPHVRCVRSLARVGVAALGAKLNSQQVRCAACACDVTRAVMRRVRTEWCD
jgi:hypothetical protein